MLKISELPVMDMMEGIKIINICNYMDSMYPNQPFGPDWDKQVRDMQEFCEINNCNYYGAPRETFSLFDAIKDTKSKRLKYVIVEDLS